MGDKSRRGRRENLRVENEVEQGERLLSVKVSINNRESMLSKRKGCLGEHGDAVVNGVISGRFLSEVADESAV